MEIVFHPFVPRSGKFCIDVIDPFKLKERPFQALIIGTPLEFYREGLFS
jgi:hypothetical protein